MVLPISSLIFPLIQFTAKLCDRLEVVDKILGLGCNLSDWVFWAFVNKLDITYCHFCLSKLDDIFRLLNDDIKKSERTAALLDAASSFQDCDSNCSRRRSFIALSLSALASRASATACAIS